MSKIQIEEFLKKKGDFVQIDHLSRFVENKEIPIDKKKFVYKKLADLYNKKGMFTEAARMYNNIAIASVTFSEKIKNYVKEAEFYIKSGNFQGADESMKKAMSEANSTEKNNIYLSIKEFYKKQAESYEKQRQRGHATRVYEKLLEMKLSDSERQEVKDNLLRLYEKLGRIKEYFSIKDGKYDKKV